MRQRFYKSAVMLVAGLMLGWGLVFVSSALAQEGAAAPVEDVTGSDQALVPGRWSADNFFRLLVAGRSDDVAFARFASLVYGCDHRAADQTAAEVFLSAGGCHSFAADLDGEGLSEGLAHCHDQS